MKTCPICDKYPPVNLFQEDGLCAICQEAIDRFFSIPENRPPVLRVVRDDD